ncbi:hypothetical protein JRQ81_005853 [Phrynocephalus forsythii]|uniref:INO80 complex subunit F domain-containing protein n=1 Tax=Phrynocephalus forsythii TaxID=171643 RepID=A0A9Q1AVZ1_9SAUR|nr:hypothetical protein JRQ81_005853 [Phrynocephalus forsythii]
MAAVGFEEFSVPPGSELALPPLFGGNILESELETEVEFADSGIPEEEEEEGALRQQEMTRRKCQALARRCKELEQVNERMLNRLHQVQRITLQLKQERRFLMRVLDSYGDDYRQGHLDIVLEDEGSHSPDAPTPGNTENEPPEKEPPGLPQVPCLPKSLRVFLPPKGPPPKSDGATCGRKRKGEHGVQPKPCSQWRSFLCRSSLKRISSVIKTTSLPLPGTHPAPETSCSITPSFQVLGLVLILTEAGSHLPDC